MPSGSSSSSEAAWALDHLGSRVHVPTLLRAGGRNGKVTRRNTKRICSPRSARNAFTNSQRWSTRQESQTEKAFITSHVLAKLHNASVPACVPACLRKKLNICGHCRPLQGAVLGSLQCRATRMVGMDSIALQQAVFMECTPLLLHCYPFMVISFSH